MPCTGEAAADIEGVFRSEELGAELDHASPGRRSVRRLLGLARPGRDAAAIPFGGDVWLLPCPRALDYSPPGDWTLHFRRDAQGDVAGLQVGCWLARKLEYRRA